MNYRVFWGLITTVTVLPVLFGCETKTRAPFCKEGEFSFPPEAAGRYRFSMASQSAAYSGSFSAIQDLQFEIVGQSHYYELKVFGAPPRDALRFLAPPMQSSEDPWDNSIVFPLAVCNIEGRYYVQTHKSDGTYNLARFDVSPTGLTTSGLFWSPESLRAAGVGYHMMPELSGVSVGGGISFDLASPVQLIVDNAGMTDEIRSLLLSKSRPSPVGMVYERVPAHAENKKPAAFVLRLKKSSAAL